MKPLLRFLVIIVALFLMSNAHYGQTAPRQVVLLDGWVLTDLNAFQEEHEQFVVEQKKAAIAKMQLLKSDRIDNENRIMGDQTYYTIKALGLLHAKEAVPLLLDRIDIKYVGWNAAQAAPDSVVIEALAAIGKPASIASIEYLAKDKSSARLPRYVRVIYLVEGPDVGKFMLQRAAEMEQDPEKKARLARAIELIPSANKIVP